jgi:hypothetical protein
MKNQIVSHYKQLIQDRIDIFQDMIADLTVDAQNDAKGSAGDKHETALSMMHLEQEKLNHKLQEIYTQKQVLDQIDPFAVHQKIALGSVVLTNGMWLFMSAALPKITVDQKTVFALSPQSPLGSLLMGQTVGAVVSVHDKSYTIEQVL